MVAIRTSAALATRALLDTPERKGQPMTPEDLRGNDAGGADDALDALMRQGEDACNDGRYEEAETRLREAIERFPDSPLPHHAMSVVYLTHLREDYEHLEVWEDLADDEATFEAAVGEAEAALALDPDFTPARNNLATLFALRGWWADAAEQWEMSLSTDPGQPDVREELQEARRHMQ
jgi:tetratricopeptide (TPR) repeat protein